MKPTFNEMTKVLQYVKKHKVLYNRKLEGRAKIVIDHMLLEKYLKLESKGTNIYVVAAQAKLLNTRRTRK